MKRINSDIFKPYEKSKLDEKLAFIRERASTETGFNYDYEICLAELDIPEASAYREALNYFAILIAAILTIKISPPLFAAFLVIALTFYITVSSNKLSHRIHSAKQNVLILKLAKNQSEPNDYVHIML